MKCLESVGSERRLIEDVGSILSRLFGGPEESARLGQRGQQFYSFLVCRGVHGNCSKYCDPVAQLQVGAGNPPDAEATEIQDRGVVFEAQTCDGHISNGWDQYAVWWSGLWNDIAEDGFP